jgi:hypothetical protein
MLSVCRGAVSMTWWISSARRALVHRGSDKGSTGFACVFAFVLIPVFPFHTSPPLLLLIHSHHCASRLPPLRAMQLDTRVRRTS